MGEIYQTVTRPDGTRVDVDRRVHCPGCGASMADCCARGQGVLRGWGVQREGEGAWSHWCAACWAMPPDLAALLRAVDADPVTLGNLVGVRVACAERQAGFLGRADILADWLEDRGDRRSPRLRAMLSQPVVWLVNVLALFPPTWRA